MPRPTTSRGYARAAQERIRAYLREQQAAVRVELITHLAEYYFQRTDDPDDFNIDPHLAGPALSRMIQTREVLETSERTRGRRLITTYTLNPRRPGSIRDIVTPTSALTTAQQRAAGRKRLLYARYLSWASGSRTRPGSAGPAAEAAARQALSGARNVAPLAAEFGPVDRIDDLTLPGPLDSAAAVTVSPVAAPVLALIEVKNVRDWIYPNSEEVWQLVWKSMIASTSRPSWSVLPVFVCRRCHPTLIWMAGSLGMLVVQTRSAPMGKIEPAAHLDEVRLELSLSDLKAGTTPPDGLKRWMRKTLPTQAAPFSAVWSETVSDPTCRELLKHLAATRSIPTRAIRDLLLTRLDTRCRELGRRGWEAIRLDDTEAR